MAVPLATDDEEVKPAIVVEVAEDGIGRSVWQRGGKARAPLLPILGREKVVRFLLAVTQP